MKGEATMSDLSFKENCFMAMALARTIADNDELLRVCTTPEKKAAFIESCDVIEKSLSLALAFAGEVRKDDPHFELDILTGKSEALNRLRSIPLRTYDMYLAAPMYYITCALYDALWADMSDMVVGYVAFANNAGFGLWDNGWMNYQVYEDSAHRNYPDYLNMRKAFDLPPFSSKIYAGLNKIGGTNYPGTTHYGGM